jgi:hypothetical protein
MGNRPQEPKSETRSRDGVDDAAAGGTGERGRVASCNRRPYRCWAANLLADGRRLPPRNHLSSEDTRALRSCVSRRANDRRFAEASQAEFFEEGTAFLRSSDSGKPARLILANLRWQRLRENQFSSVNRASRTDDARKFPEDVRSCRVEVEDPVHQRHVDRGVRQR